MPKLRLILIISAVLIVVLGAWALQRFTLQADEPLGGSSYTSQQTAVVTALAETLGKDPSVSNLLSDHSCPSSGGKYNLDPNALGQALAGLFTGNSEEDCYQITIDGSIRPQIYWMSLSRAILVVSGSVNLTIEYYDADCVLRSETINDFTFKMAFSINNNGQVGGVVPLPRGKPICIINLPSQRIHEVIGRLDQENCCELPIETETEL